MASYVTNWTQPAKHKFILPLTMPQATSTYTIGRVYLEEVEIPENCTVYGIQFYCYATAAGNVTVGLYSQASEGVADNGVLLASSASTAVPGINQQVLVAFASATAVTAGRYFLAIEFSDNTNTCGKPNSITLCANICYYDRGGGYGALTNPCPVTTTLNSSATFPCIALKLSV
jgi:hypothetical protein